MIWLVAVLRKHVIDESFKELSGEGAEGKRWRDQWHWSARMRVAVLRSWKSHRFPEGKESSHLFSGWGKWWRADGSG